jgi:hypothetical protein
MAASCNTYTGFMCRVRRDGAEDRKMRSHRPEFKRNLDGVYVIPHAHEAPEQREKVLREFWEQVRLCSWDHKKFFAKIAYWYVYTGECVKENMHLRYEWVWLFRDYFWLIKKGFTPDHPYNAQERWRLDGVWVHDTFLPIVFKTRFGRPAPSASPGSTPLSSSGSLEFNRSSSSSSSSEVDGAAPAAKRQKLNDDGDYVGGR